MNALNVIAGRLVKREFRRILWGKIIYPIKRLLTCLLIIAVLMGIAAVILNIV